MSGPTQHGIARLQIEELEQRHSDRVVRALYCGLNSFVSLGLMALLAFGTHAPFVFPSLGPTAFLLFYTPRDASASPAG
jgi:CBS domain-containing membrane protein